jgi:DNA helicase HerA-like ATPase
LLTLELNNRQLLTGSEQLDVDALLGTGSHSQPGRVRLTVVSTRFLEPSKLDFWVSQLLVAIARWCAKSPRPHLQAVFLFDEADIYLPAGTRQPATKAPMEDLLKRARSAGVGIFLATQSPGDFDYKCKENVRTWLIGGVKEPRALDKLKPMLAAKGNVLDKLAAQKTGEFHLVRESTVTAVRSHESFIRTEQLSEDRIVQLARESRSSK